MSTTYKITEVTEDHVYAVFTFDDGSSFGKIFPGLVCADQAELDKVMTGFIAGHAQEQVARQARPQKQFDPRSIIRQSRPVDAAVVAEAIESARAAIEDAKGADEKRSL